MSRKKEKQAKNVSVGCYPVSQEKLETLKVGDYIRIKSQVLIITKIHDSWVEAKLKEK